jgi:hypothetical protein
MRTYTKIEDHFMLCKKCLEMLGVHVTANETAGIQPRHFSMFSLWKFKKILRESHILRELNAQSSDKNDVDFRISWRRPFPLKWILK